MVLEQAATIFDTFVQKAGAAPEFAEAVKRAKDRSQDIRDTARFIKEGQTAGGHRRAQRQEKEQAAPADDGTGAAPAEGDQGAAPAPAAPARAAPAAPAAARSSRSAEAVEIFSRDARNFRGGRVVSWSAGWFCLEALAGQPDA